MDGKEKVLMHLDPLMIAILLHIDPSYVRFLIPDRSMIVRLAKPLYGLVKARKIWYDTLSAYLIELDFKANPVEPCVFNKTTAGRAQITIALFVDDLMITSIDSDEFDKLIAALRRKFKTITANTGKVHSYLGMTFDFKTLGSVKISQDHSFVNFVLIHAILAYCLS